MNNDKMLLMTPLKSVNYKNVEETPFTKHVRTIAPLFSDTLEDTADKEPSKLS